MSKEKILNRLEIKLVKLDNAIFRREGIRNDDKEYGKKRVEAIENVDNLKKEILLLFSQAIDKTREETIKEVEEMLPREKPMNTFSFALGGEELQLHMRFKGFNDCRGEVKDALNNLKQ